MRHRKYRRLILPFIIVLSAATACHHQKSKGAADGGEQAGAVPPTDSAWPHIEPLPHDPETEAFVSDLLARMTLEEKVGQVIQAELRSVTPEDIRRYHLGSVLNGGGSTPNNDKHAAVDDWLAIADAFYEASMDTSDGGQAIPIIWGSDAVHGHSNVYGATIFPHNIGLGAANDPELLRRIGEVTAIEMRVTGLDWTFAPTVAVVRDDRWGRTYEGYSEDPRIVAHYAPAIIAGLQGQFGTAGFLGDDRIVASAKHWLGDGGTVGGRDQGNTVASETELERLHNAGYEPAIRAGVRTVMASFSSWQGEKVHGHRHLLTTALKDVMGFNGFLVGDWNAHGQVEGCSNASCAASMNAGLDMFMAPGDFAQLYENTAAQVRDGTIEAARLDDAVRRVLRVKHEAGLFEAGLPSLRPHAGDADRLGSPEHRELARRAVRQSLVLLKNNGSLLPLSPDARVLVAGDGADDIGKQAGGWTLTWQGTGNDNADFPGATSVYGGIRAAVEAAGGAVELAVDGLYTERPDVAVVVFGEQPYAEFQGDRANLLYEEQNGRDLALLRRLRADAIRVVAVFISGRPLWVNPHINASDAFIAAWLPGSEGGGVADLLFRRGDGSMPYDFTGRLSFSWPRTATQTTVNVGDPDYDPLFAYGYGLGLNDDGRLPVLSEESGLTGAGIDGAATWYNDGRALAGFSSRAGRSRDELRTIEGLEMAGPDLSPSVLMADHEVQGDASRLLWREDAPGWFVIESDGGPIDLARNAQDMALSFVMKVDRVQSAPVAVGMRDASGGSASFDITAALDAASDWRDHRIPLKCFEEAGIELGQVIAPFEIHSTGAAELVLAEVRLAAVTDPVTECPLLEPGR